MSYTDTARKRLNRSLEALPTSALEAIKAGLETEPYVCVGTWVNNGVCEISNKSVGCLLAAAYMHTSHYEEELRHANHRRVMSEFDGDPESTLRDAFDIAWDESDPIEEIVNAFDSWANTSDALHEYISYGKGHPLTEDGKYMQNVLTKRAQNSLIRTIDRLIKERS